MKEEVPEIQFYSRTNSLLDSLPDFVKDPKNYDKIQRALLETLASKHSHSDLVKVAECKECSEKMLERRALMKKFGFKSAAQYMAWRKVHEEIKRRMPLDKYNQLVNEQS